MDEGGFRQQHGRGPVAPGISRRARDSWIGLWRQDLLPVEVMRGARREALGAMASERTPRYAVCFWPQGGGA